jgi:hypothetical protein
MSTPKTTTTVKQTLLEKLHREILPELEQLIEQLPDQLLDFQQAETCLRQGMLKVAQGLLEKWAAAADLAVQRPCCWQCGVPMRNKGRVPSRVVTTLGDVVYHRPRWRCEDCHHECYPHDEVLCFLEHRVSWPLAKVVSRLAAQLGSFEEARDNLKEDYAVPLAKETVRDVAEAAGQRILHQEDELRQRIKERQAPLPESEQTPAKACVFADGTTVHTEGEWHEIRVATVTTENAAGNMMARQSRARFLPVDEVAWVLLLMARGRLRQRALARLHRRRFALVVAVGRAILPQRRADFGLVSPGRTRAQGSQHLARRRNGGGEGMEQPAQG